MPLIHKEKESTKKKGTTMIKKKMKSMMQTLKEKSIIMQERGRKLNFQSRESEKIRIESKERTK